jgi:hypothetical protein
MELPKMYGAPSDCKEKADGETTSLRKCIRPLVGHRAPGQDELRSPPSLAAAIANPHLKSEMWDPREDLSPPDYG